MPQVIKRLDSLFKLSLEQPSPEKEPTSFQDRENEENSLIHNHGLGTWIDPCSSSGALSGGLCDTNLSTSYLDTNSHFTASKKATLHLALLVLMFWMAVKTLAAFPGTLIENNNNKKVTKRASVQGEWGNWYISVYFKRKRCTVIYSICRNHCSRNLKMPVLPLKMTGWSARRATVVDSFPGPVISCWPLVFSVGPFTVIVFHRFLLWMVRSFLTNDTHFFSHHNKYLKGYACSLCFLTPSLSPFFCVSPITPFLLSASVASFVISSLYILWRAHVTSYWRHILMLTLSFGLTHDLRSSLRKRKAFHTEGRRKMVLEVYEVNFIKPFPQHITLRSRTLWGGGGLPWNIVIYPERKRMSGLGTGKVWAISSLQGRNTE